jgi:magnesium transporter
MFSSETANDKLKVSSEKQTEAAPRTMLRSLVASNNDNGEFSLRRNLTPASLEEAVTNRKMLWIDAVDSDDKDLTWLESVFNLHPAVVTDLRRADRRPTLLVYPDYLFLSLFQASLKGFNVESSEVHIIVGDHFFITVRSGVGASAVDVAYDRAAQNMDFWKRGVSYFLYLTVQAVIDAYYPQVDRISNQLNTLEEDAMSRGGRASQQSIYRVKQQLISLRQMVAPQREVLSNVIGEERLSRSNENRDLFRHLYERVLRLYDVIDSQRDLASNVLDLIERQESTRLANAVSRLTVFSMIFLPLTFLVGLFGLNFVTTQPELTIPLSGALMFALIIGLTVLCAGVLMWQFRKRGWL